MIAARIVGGERLVDWLEGLPDAVSAGIGRAMLRLAQQLRSAVQDKLSGAVLQPRSGRLRADIRAATDTGGSRITATVGSDLAYAAAQEYGFAGTVEVRAHLRQIRQAFGRPIAAETVAVGGFSRRMKLPDRAFLRPALAELGPAIEAEMREALHRAVGR